MSKPDFDLRSTFNEDYLYFYEPRFTAELNRAEADEILTTLDLDVEASILDAPCGHGRISNLLAMAGYRVTGVDITPLFLETAEANAVERGLPVDYHLGDLRDLPIDGPFDAVVCWFTSFGYFDDAGNRAVLDQFARVLRPGGRLLVETLHHDGFVRSYTPSPAAMTVERGDDLLVDTSTFDPVTGRVETDRTAHRDGEIRRSHQSVRLPTVPEFDDWLARAGFSERSYTTRGGQPLRYDSWRLVVSART